MVHINLLSNLLGSQLSLIHLHLKLYKDVNVANFVYYGKTRFHSCVTFMCTSHLCVIFTQPDIYSILLLANVSSQYHIALASD